MLVKMKSCLHLQRPNMSYDIPSLEKPDQQHIIGVLLDYDLVFANHYLHAVLTGCGWLSPPSIQVVVAQMLVNIAQQTPLSRTTDSAKKIITNFFYLYIYIYIYTQ